MAKREPVLEFRLSKLNQFHCSFCGDVLDEGTFVAHGEVDKLIEAFKDHVAQYHLRGEDFSQAAALFPHISRP